MARYAGVDLGATNVKAVVGDSSGSVLGTARAATPHADGSAVAARVGETLLAACRDADVSPDTLLAVGVGTFGPLDLAAGVVDGPANLPAERIPLAETVRDYTGTERVVLQNDTTAGVVAERFYSDRTPDDMVYLTISTGIGAGVAVDGNVIGGWDGNAGEVGHMVVDPDGEMVCGCGTAGHWEAYCSGSNVPRFARQVHRETGVDTSLPLDDLDAAAVFDAPDDPLAREVIDRVATYNAVGVANIVHAYAPLVVSLGGAVARENPDLVVEPIRERVPGLVLNNVPEIRLTELGDLTVAKGALASALAGTNDPNRVSL